MFTVEEMKVMHAMIGRAQCAGTEAAAVAVVMQKIAHEVQKAQAPKTEVPIKDDEE